MTIRCDMDDFFLIQKMKITKKELVLLVKKIVENVLGNVKVSKNFVEKFVPRSNELPNHSRPKMQPRPKKRRRISIDNPERNLIIETLKRKRDEPSRWYLESHGRYSKRA